MSSDIEQKQKNSPEAGARIIFHLENMHLAYQAIVDKSRNELAKVDE